MSRTHTEMKIAAVGGITEGASLRVEERIQIQVTSDKLAAYRLVMSEAWGNDWSLREFEEWTWLRGR